MALQQPGGELAVRSGTDDLGLVARWRAELAGTGTRVALADGADPRVVQAAVELVSYGLTPCIVGLPERVRAVAEEAGLSLPDSVEILDPVLLDDGAAGEAVAAALQHRSSEEIERCRADALYLAVGALAAGAVDACVAGATRTTSDVLRAALRVVGTDQSTSSVSSCFVLELSDGRVVAFADCAVLPEPNVEQLGEIAMSTADTFAVLTGQVPKVAMLSFSTLGSADHPSIEVVRRATEQVRAQRPGLAIDGELQFDAAVVETVARHKAPGSVVGGEANVLVFPNLAAGNIAYKITERLAGATAHGPILQGLDRPVHDLSRGCSAADIVGVALIAGLQSTTVTRSATPVPLR